MPPPSSTTFERSLTIASLDRSTLVLRSTPWLKCSIAFMLTALSFRTYSRRCYSSMPCLPLSRRLPPLPFKRSSLRTCSLAACTVILSLNMRERPCLPPTNCQRLSARVKTLLIDPRSVSNLRTSLIAPQPRAARTRAKGDPRRSRSESAAPGSTGSRSVRARGTRTLTWHLLPPSRRISLLCPSRRRQSQFSRRALDQAPPRSHPFLRMQLPIAR